MVLIGLFSTHLTYLFLAAVYVFGYSAYALNCKQDACDVVEAEPKGIAFEASASDHMCYQQSDSFYWAEGAKTDEAPHSADLNLRFNYSHHNVISKEHFYSLLYHLKLTVSFASRPPPCFA